MSVPITVRGLFRQRLRWGRGLVQVLLKHGVVLFRWRNRRNWPVIIEAILSLLWWHVLVVVVVLGVALASIDIAGYEDVTPFPWGWVAAVITIALGQLATGLLIDRRYDPSTTMALGPMPWYPIGYWFLVGCTSVFSTIPTLIRPRSGPNVTWKVDRGRE